MKYSLLAIICLLLIAEGFAQRPGENDNTNSVSYTVPISIEYERYLIDSVFSFEERSDAEEPFTGAELDLEGEYGIAVQFYLQDPRLIDVESLSRIVAGVGEYYNFRDLLEINLQLDFCMEGFTLLEQGEDVLPDSLEYQSAYFQREWFSNLRRYLERSDITDDKQNFIPVVIMDMDAVGFASMSGHKGATDVIVLSSRLLSEDIKHRDATTTLAHLIANYLNVKPLWYNEQGRGDLVDDTPCHDAPNFGKTTDEVHLSLCTPIEVELSHNLMDNLNDDFRFGFTKGQVQRLAHCLTRKPQREGLLNNPCRDGLNEEEPQTLGLQILQSTLTLEPNPATTTVLIHVKSSSSVNGAFNIINASGAKVLSGTIVDDMTQVDITELSSGIYYVISELNGGGDVFKNRLVITK